MATLVLAVGAAAISSGLGLTAAAAAGSIAASIGVAAIGAVASILGTIIDSYLFAPHYTQEGPRLNELQVQGSTEGAPIPESWGWSRLSGQMIWGTRFKEVITKETEDVGGKGGGGGEVTTTTYDYYMSMAFGVTRNATNWDRIWADGKLAYRKAAGINESLTSTQVVFIRESIDTSIFGTIIGGEGEYFIAVQQSEFDANIPSVEVGAKIVVTGAATGANNQTYTVLGTTVFDGSKVKIQVEEEVTDEDGGASVTLNVTELTAIDELNDPEFYNGTTGQNVNSTIETIQGSGNVPAYRSVAYVVMTDVHLERFGNRIPNFIFEVENEP